MALYACSGVWFYGVTLFHSQQTVNTLVDEGADCGRHKVTHTHKHTCAHKHTNPHRNTHTHTHTNSRTHAFRNVIYRRSDKPTVITVIVSKDCSSKTGINIRKVQKMTRKTKCTRVNTLSIKNRKTKILGEGWNSMREPQWAILLQE